MKVYPEVDDACLCENKKCGHTFKLQPFDVVGASAKEEQEMDGDGFPVRCPKCNSYEVRRVS